MEPRKRRPPDPDYPPPIIVKRDTWGAVPPKYELEELVHPAKYIWFRETPNTPPCLTNEACIAAVQKIQKNDQKVGPEIRANFLVGDDGRVYEGRGWKFKPDYCDLWKRYDGQYIEVAYIGPFNDLPEENSERLKKVFGNFMFHSGEQRFLVIAEGPTVESSGYMLLGDPPPFITY